MDFVGQQGVLKRRVLVVDDEMVNREILGNFLSTVYTVDYASNAKIALGMLMNPDVEYSLVLLDLIMPVMSGIEFLEHRVESDRLKSVPVVVMTSEKAFEIKCLKLGAADFITKPFNLPEVVLARCERIIELFEKKSIIRNTEKDVLTGLLAKDYFFEYVRRSELLGKQIPRDALVFDIERFHLVNEFCGRVFGNMLLSKIGEALISILSKMNAFACRAHADTFYIFAEHQEDYSELRKALDSAGHFHTCAD